MDKEYTPEPVDVTPEMIEAGTSALSEYYVGIRECYEEDVEAAVIAVFHAMLRARESRLSK